MDTLVKKKEKVTLVIASTNRQGSLTEVVAGLCIERLKQKKQRAEMLSLRELTPDFTQKALYAQRGKDPNFNRLAGKVEKADKLIFVVPQYNGSFPGVLKTFIDGLTVGPLDKGQVVRYKKCALIGVSKGAQGNILGLSHLTDVLTYLGMYIYAPKLYLSSVKEPSLDAVKAHPDYLERLEKQVDGFINF
ncbi:MAG: NAD(P)H-dependent oxidoreductase [Bacteroidota bacterium]